MSIKNEKKSKEPLPVEAFRDPASMAGHKARSDSDLNCFQAVTFILRHDVPVLDIISRSFPAFLPDLLPLDIAFGFLFIDGRLSGLLRS
jgi:hypothetical protein